MAEEASAAPSAPPASEGTARRRLISSDEDLFDLGEGGSYEESVDTFPMTSSVVAAVLAMGDPAEQAEALHPTRVSLASTVSDSSR
eukprot:15421852-Alexandrium_andersonii.AAC.1